VRGKQVRINVSGQTFETMRRTLEKFPDTLLGSDERDYFYDAVAGEYFFDRDPGLFRYVLAYYRSVNSHDCVSEWWLAACGVQPLVMG